MKIKSHPVEKFDDEDYKHHAAHWITEVIDPDNPNESQKFCGYRGLGFYYCQEDEATVIGPFETFEKAVEERDKYFKTLDIDEERYSI